MIPPAANRKHGSQHTGCHSANLPVEKTIPSRTWALLQLLADGKFHSGEALANRLDISRATVFNALSTAGDYGVELQRIRGRGYRLARAWQRLEQGEILHLLGQQAGQFNIEVVPQAPSSNTLLLQRTRLKTADGNPCSGSVLAVEFQTAGRGRMGRTWCSALGDTLTFSLLWRFDCGLNALSGLSLAAGVAVARALKLSGAGAISLKWPNDILTSGGKLGGILIETQGDMLGPTSAVIGIGLNCTLRPNLAGLIDQPASALDEICTNMPTRNQLLATILLELASTLKQFTQSGFVAWRDEWEQYHIHQNKPVQLRTADGSVVNGIARGVSDNGDFCVETAQGIRRFNSGEVGSTV